MLLGKISPDSNVVCLRMTDLTKSYSHYSIN